MADVEPTPIRTFISYSWSSPTHESWVLSLASRLREDGVDAILDKWDLQHGHDAYKFMEQMVTDPTVSKVLMVCDRKYAEKADKREGGVGAESQIISPELYGKSVQDKFAAAITELDDEGRAYVPTFYKGRIYFDFSSDEKYEEKYEELLRWILGKPLRVKPALGAPPRHLEKSAITIGTESKYQRAVAAIRLDTTSATGLFREYSDALVEDFEKIRISGANKPELDNEIVESIEAARPYLIQTIGLATAVARYSKNEQIFDEFLRMLERLGKYMYRPDHISSHTDWDFDNYKYLCHEIFLTTFSILLREERFDLAMAMVEHAYLIEVDSGGNRSTSSYDEYRPYLRSLDGRNQRLKLRRISLHADLLEAAYKDRTPSFNDLMQADFVLHLRDAIKSLQSGAHLHWYPVTLVYASRRYRPFDLFARSESKKYFSRFMPVLNVNSVEQFKSAVEKIANSRDALQFDYQRPNIAGLSNLGNIGVVT